MRYPRIQVYLASTFVNNWLGGKFAEHPHYFARHFNETFRSGYFETERGPENHIAPMLKFPGRRLIIPVHRNGSPVEVEARRFYNGNKPFRPEEDLMPAEINGKVTKSGLVMIDWKLNY
ncbi:MAG: hypothetical protein HYT71_02300 [Candidatus Aenigmarchaeota archaeon]|nr:hypothetical protein [Candidatus Aenigmarchaeota archaeon]